MNKTQISGMLTELETDQEEKEGIGDSGGSKDNKRTAAGSASSSSGHFDYSLWTTIEYIFISHS